MGRHCSATKFTGEIKDPNILDTLLLLTKCLREDGNEELLRRVMKRVLNQFREEQGIHKDAFYATESNVTRKDKGI